ncbi:phosphodiesterase [Pectobacteriaceae bacterium CE70]|uniref:Phosphoesterase n=1 Tax=Serratia sp. (strain ATCC 39006) TaxID=104623 RepID=A0A2I5TIU4_SERS3|nr:phosphodiesterase [Serratia sp. ATCC 39006]WJV61275.1 phosphodiesterase [Pectobacteriaceae bacterium C52]WJV65603.1 phosphodiesterase [Pectobacteriaceae bacterium CE70]WJY09625.1 phosphodiesterase [Pectobacteriaceae bacterium C80]AUH00174.1 phosphodiesterase [Serratia sp. ATCC 39006]AUH04494.1 phosphodiesterase [Serratia sp. ATCC 39006]
MKLMFASDLHGSLTATETVLTQFERSGAQWLVLLGDFLNHGPRNPLPENYLPAEVAVKLNEYAPRIIAVRGNCDSEVDQMLLQFPMMAPWQQVLLPQCRLFLTHGHLYHPDQRPPLQANDVLVYGHTHIPVAERHDDIYCFNPGSVSLPKGGYPASYGLLMQNRLQVVSLAGGEVIAQVVITH